MDGAPLSILQVMRAPVGGLFRHVADLSHELSARGHRVGIVADSLSGDAASAERLARLEAVAALGVHLLPIPRLLGPQDLATPLRLRRLAKRLGVSILHGHGAKGGFEARLARLGRRDMAALYTPHGGALHFDPKTPSGALFMGIERALLGATDALIFESAHAQRVFGEKVGTPRGRHRVIHNGLAPAEFEPVAPGPDAEDFVFVGELRRLKGIDLLVEALAPLRRPDGTPASLAMAGDGPDAGQLRTRIAELGLSERITLEGVRPARQMFARGRCVVVPSRAESLPYIVLEAAAAGRPMIATNVGGIGEIYGPTAASLVAPDAVAPLREAMASQLEGPERFLEEAERRRAFVAETFSLNGMVDAIEGLYREVTTR